MNEQTNKEQITPKSKITTAQVMDKIKKAIEADKDLQCGFFIDFHETTRADNPCSRTFRAVIEMGAIISNRS